MFRMLLSVEFNSSPVQKTQTAQHKWKSLLQNQRDGKVVSLFFP